MALTWFVMASPQEQRLLCDRLFIVPELNPVKTWLLEEAVAKAKRDADDIKRVTSERDSPRSRTKHHLTRVGMVDLDPSVGRPATLGQLQENANLTIQ
jgi:hypothetical protein